MENTTANARKLQGLSNKLSELLDQLITNSESIDKLREDRNKIQNQVETTKREYDKLTGHGFKEDTRVNRSGFEDFLRELMGIDMEESNETKLQGMTPEVEELIKKIKSNPNAKIQIKESGGIFSNTIRVGVDMRKLITEEDVNQAVIELGEFKVADGSNADSLEYKEFMASTLSNLQNERLKRAAYNDMNAH